MNETKEQIEKMREAGIPLEGESRHWWFEFCGRIEFGFG